MRRFATILTAGLCGILLSGCGVSSVPGGTTGFLTCGDRRLEDIQLTLHRAEGGGFRPVGFGLTRSDGSFALLTHGATGPLWLAPGEYRCTLESAGAPIQIPQPYLDPATTPLKATWTESMTSLDLVGPSVILR